MRKTGKADLVHQLEQNVSIMHAISLSNRLPYRAIHKRFIIWSNNYSFSRYVFITRIDLFITNRRNLVLDIKVSPNFCSDHCPVSVDINIKTSKEQCYKRTIRKYAQADYNSIIHEMEGKNWSILFENKTVSEN
jgi:hypothetical protein